MAVVINHAFPDFLTGGYVGVDIFFVISGYLISQIIVSDIEASNFSIIAFYQRRSRRILPALFVVLFVSIAGGWFLLSPLAYKELARTTISTSLFVSNFDFAKITGYFDGAAALKPLLHTWSLAVEEQYYLIFPFLICVIWQNLGRRIARSLLCLIALASLVISEIGHHLVNTEAYYLLPFRGVEFLIGTLVAVCGLPTLRDARIRHAISLLGIGMMLAAIIGYKPATPFPGVASLLPCIGAGLLIYAGVSAESIGGRLLSFQPALYLGAISYSLYLWHWPILAFLRNLTNADLPIVWAAAGILGSILLASLSYHFVERPFLNDRKSSLPYLRIAGGGIGTLVIASANIYFTNGFPSRFSSEARQMFAASLDYNHRRNECHNSAGPTAIPYYKSCIFGNIKANPDLAVWGDSHGVELAAYLGDRAARRGRSVRELTSSACPPVVHITVADRPYCSKTNQETLDALAGDSAIRTVILSVNSLRYDDKLALENGMRASVKALLAARKHVVLVKQTPIMPYDVPEKAGFLVEHHVPPESLGVPRGTALAQADPYDAFLDELSRDYNLVDYDPKNSLCFDNFCHAVRRGPTILYFNADHLSMTGVRFAFATLADRFYGS